MTWLLRLAMAVVVIVGAIAAVVSYSHMQELAVRAGEGWRSYLIPLTVDGLIIAAGMVLAVRRQMGLAGGVLAWGGLAVGVVASIAANMADARPETTAILVAGWAPVAFAWTFELIQQLRRLPASSGATDASGSAGLPAPPAPQPSVPAGLTDPPGRPAVAPSTWPAPAPRTPANRASSPGADGSPPLPSRPPAGTTDELVDKQRPGESDSANVHPKEARGNGAGPTYKGGEGAGASTTTTHGLGLSQPGSSSPEQTEPRSETPERPHTASLGEVLEDWPPVTPKPSTRPSTAPGSPQQTPSHPPDSSKSPPSKRQGPPATTAQILEAIDSKPVGMTYAELAASLGVSESSLYRAKRSRTNGHPVGVQ